MLINTQRTRSEGVVVLVFVVMVLWLGAKSGFVRYDGHAYRYSLLLLVLLCACILATSAQTLGPLQVGGFSGLSAVLLLAGTSLSTFSFWNGPANAVEVVRTLTSSTRRQQIVLDGRRNILTRDPVSGVVRNLLRNRRVHAEATDIATLWALNQSTWVPAPVIQSYSAYTNELDDLNAAFYASSGSANSVLYRASYGDGHHPRFTSPKAIVTMLCHFSYRQTSDPVWEVFVRTGPRCGVPEDRGTYQGRLGQEVDWGPTSEDDRFIVIGSFSLDRSWTERINAMIRVRPRTWSVTFGNGDLAKYRFDPATAEQSHLLAVPSCIRGQLGKFDTRTYNPIGVYQSDHAPIIPVTLTIKRIPFRC